MYADETDRESAWNTISQNHQSVTYFSCWFGASDPKILKKLMDSSVDPDVSLYCGKTQSLLKTKALVKIKEVQCWLLPPACEVSVSFLG